MLALALALPSYAKTHYRSCDQPSALGSAPSTLFHLGALAPGGLSAFPPKSSGDCSTSALKEADEYQEIYTRLVQEGGFEKPPLGPKALAKAPPYKEEQLSPSPPDPQETEQIQETREESQPPGTPEGEPSPVRDLQPEGHEFVEMPEPTLTTLREVGTAVALRSETPPLTAGTSTPEVESMVSVIGAFPCTPQKRHDRGTPSDDTPNRWGDRTKYWRGGENHPQDLQVQHWYPPPQILSESDVSMSSGSSDCDQTVVNPAALEPFNPTSEVEEELALTQHIHDTGMGDLELENLYVSEPELPSAVPTTILVVDLNQAEDSHDRQALSVTHAAPSHLTSM
ncbi:hypothetical protein KEM56_000855 [Ascosphaera pollenicola]|nr:hypothetical protein KEM56_000855 [Ascosphaera pollenicola]